MSDERETEAWIFPAIISLEIVDNAISKVTVLPSMTTEFISDRGFDKPRNYNEINGMLFQYLSDRKLEDGTYPLNWEG